MLVDLMVPLSVDRSVRSLVGLNLFFALVNLIPERPATSLATIAPNLGSALSPVPTAVPPIGSSRVYSSAWLISFSSLANSSA